jgi:DNA-binding beta-propeller fold protein YncE
MALRRRGEVALPAHRGTGGFDHAAVHEPTGRIYVAHTANDAVDVIDVERARYERSIEGLPAVAGALVSDAAELVVTSNRGDDTIGLFGTAGGGGLQKVAVGLRPNGLAFDSRRARVLVAHVGDPAVPGSHTVSVVDVCAPKVVATVPVAGRTRWTIYDPVADAFHVNIMDPPQIAVVEAGDPVCVRRVVSIAHAGPHGLDIDVARRRLYCACDAGVLVEVDADTGAVLATEAIAGPPDVVCFNSGRGHLYVAIGEPGVIEVFDTSPLRRLETVPTERGAHTLAFSATRDLVAAFLPGTHRAALYEDVGGD